MAEGEKSQSEGKSKLYGGNYNMTLKTWVNKSHVAFLWCKNRRIMYKFSCKIQPTWHIITAYQTTMLLFSSIIFFLLLRFHDKCTLVSFSKNLPRLNYNKLNCSKYLLCNIACFPVQTICIPYRMSLETFNVIYRWTEKHTPHLSPWSNQSGSARAECKQNPHLVRSTQPRYASQRPISQWSVEKDLHFLTDSQARCSSSSFRHQRAQYSRVKSSLPPRRKKILVALLQ